jgi:hypothetical protein
MALEWLASAIREPERFQKPERFQGPEQEQ